MYRHYVKAICEWLDDLVKSINNPIAALEKQSIRVTSNVVLKVNLNMTSPPHMAKLEALAGRLRQNFELLIEAAPIATAPDIPVNDGNGILGRVGIWTWPYQYGFGEASQMTNKKMHSIFVSTLLDNYRFCASEAGHSTSGLNV